MRPGQVLDMRSDLLSRFADPKFAHVVAMSFTSDHQAVWDQRGDTPMSTLMDQRTVAHNAEVLTNAHLNHVRAAECFHVTEPLCDMLEYAAQSLDTEDTWNPALMPTGCGIVRFDKPILVRELRGRTMKAHWMVWGPVAAVGKDGRNVPVTLMTWYNDQTDPDEVGNGAGLDEVMAEADVEVRRVLGRWNWVGAEFREAGMPIGPLYFPPPDALVQQVIAEGDTPTDLCTNLASYALALFTMLNQTIATTRPADVERPARRRAEKARLPARVTVVQLRRSEHRPSEGQSLVDWQHQWWVRGHRRWQHHGCRSCPGGGEHTYGMVEADDLDHETLIYRCTAEGCDHEKVWTYVRPYLKGPEDKPLIQSEKVYDLSR